MLRLADFNKDGIPDLLLYERDSPRAFVGLGDGKGNFTFSWIWLSPGYDIIEAGDLNGDGAADLVLYNSQTGTAHIGLSDGAGGFRFTYHLWRHGISRIRIGDVDGDGHPDLLLYSKSGGQADLGYGDGSGGFRFKNLLWGPGYDTIEVADFNGDGKAGFLLYNSTTGTAYTAVSDGSAAVFTYHYHLWMPQLIVGSIEDSGQILGGPPILFSFHPGAPLYPPGTPDFVAVITDPKAVATARQLAQSGSFWMCGQVILYRTPYNPNWPYHFRPETIHFAEVTAEALQGGFPSPVDDPIYWANMSSLCVAAGVSVGVNITEIGPLRP